MLILDKTTIDRADKWDPATGGIDRNAEKSSKSFKVNQSLNIFEDIKVYDYAFEVFNQLRLKDGITHEMIQSSFNPALNFKQACKAGESTGKSGSFFFFTFDDRFIIKTIQQEELEAFIDDLESYFQHIMIQESSLISRIYGIYQVQIGGILPINFIL